MTLSISIQLDPNVIRQARRVLDEGMWRARLRAAMNESLIYLQGLVQQGTPVNTGKLRGSIFTEMRGTETNLRGQVASPLFYGLVVEMGRRPGRRMPPLAAIGQWAQRKLGLSADEAMKAAWPIARAIAIRGIPARFMFRNAAARGASMVEEIFRLTLGRPI